MWCVYRVHRLLRSLSPAHPHCQKKLVNKVYLIGHYHFIPAVCKRLHIFIRLSCDDLRAVVFFCIDVSYHAIAYYSANYSAAAEAFKFCLTDQFYGVNPS